MEHFDPGIHDIPAERYMNAEGCSASMLDILAESTPLHLRWWLKTEKKPDTTALRFGVLCHYAILQGDLYKVSFHVRPEGLKMTTTNRRYPSRTPFISAGWWKRCGTTSLPRDSSTTGRPSRVCSATTSWAPCASRALIRSRWATLWLTSKPVSAPAWKTSSG